MLGVVFRIAYVLSLALPPVLLIGGVLAIVYYLKPRSQGPRETTALEKAVIGRASVTRVNYLMTRTELEVAIVWPAAFRIVTMTVKTPVAA